MDAATWTLIYYLCAAPVPGAATLSCEARQVSANTCEIAEAHVEAGLAAGRRFFSVGCLVTRAAPSPIFSATPRPRPTERPQRQQ